MQDPRLAFATEQRDKINNQDTAFAERILLRDGSFAWVLCIADGVTCCAKPREASSMAVSAFRHALENATADVLRNRESARQWARNWSNALQESVFQRLGRNEGYSTFGAVVLVPRGGAPDQEPDWDLLVIRAGDSPAFMVGSTDDVKTAWPKAPVGRPHADASGLLRGVGLEVNPPGADLFDVDVYPVSANAHFWLWMGSDGPFKYVCGSDLRELCEQSNVPFSQLPIEVLNLSYMMGRQSGRRLDNATVLVLGFGVSERTTLLAPHFVWPWKNVPQRISFAARHRPRLPGPFGWESLILTFLLGLLLGVGAFLLPRSVPPKIIAEQPGSASSKDNGPEPASAQRFKYSNPSSGDYLARPKASASLPEKQSPRPESLDSADKNPPPPNSSESVSEDHSGDSDQSASAPMTDPAGSSNDSQYNIVGSIDNE